MNFNKKNILKVLIFIIVIIIIFLFLIYKIFGLSSLTFLSGIIGPQTYTAKFNINNADWISEKSVSCITDKTFTCKVKAPEIIKKGALIIGWNYEPDSKNASFLPGDEILIDSKTVNFYAITIPRIEVLKMFEIESLKIEFEKGLNYEKSVDLRIKSLNKLYRRWPFMFKNREKLNILTAESFQNFNKSTYDGVTYWGKRYIDINEADANYTIIHELAHALDFDCTIGLNRVTYKVSNWKKYKYDVDFNYDIVKLISESSDYDFIKLYDKYKNALSNKRPLTDYSYTNEHEFFADAMFYYYDYKYEHEYNDVINDEIKKAVEKLIEDINSGQICKVGG